jgi:KipI family sensor histidine kinase inhibitor
MTLLLKQEFFVIKEDFTRDAHGFNAFLQRLRISLRISLLYWQLRGRQKVESIEATDMHYYLLGERGAVMQSPLPQAFDCQRRLWAVAAQLQQAASFTDVITGMNNLTVVFDPLRHDGPQVLAQLAQLWESTAAHSAPQRQIEIPVHYGGDDGPDLAAVARHTGLSEQQVIEAHTGADYCVYFLGFQPGFAYLGGLPPALAIPRLATPRTRVPPGSVGIGANQTGIYPFASPGGWQLIGRTALPLFDPAATPPTLLQAGDLVRFVAINKKSEST